ncbi:hypothetical protein GGR56DRAFT_529907 [Xylariaceae sp. FL0804]|nr:hypothetical protein GGR56DRAFT_529907 [Xylariaceae sp. FL0804]
MYTKAALISALVAAAEARFGQEQIPVAAVSALTAFGNPGDAGTLSGAVPGVLLAAANPCDKLSLADQIVSELGTNAQVLAAAKGVVEAEQNFNPFSVSVPSICDDASLPATAALRGIVPLVDPAVTGADTENANAKASLTTAFDATGLSVAGVMKAQGFSNFTSVANDGTADSSASSSSTTTTAAAAAVATTKASCGGSQATTLVTVTTSAAATAAAAASTGSSNAASGTATGAGAVTDAVTGNFAGFQASSLGLDFGTCTPTVKFEAGLDGRSDDESTFQAQDPVVNQGQEEALNPEIIFNRICDQLVNVCGAADDAHAACESASAALGGGAKDASTANKWNARLGFAGTDINPDNAPKAGLVGHT